MDERTILDGVRDAIAEGEMIAGIKIIRQFTDLSLNKAREVAFVIRDLDKPTPLLTEVIPVVQVRA